MPSRKPFKRSISNIQPEPIPPAEVVFSTLPTTSIESSPADNKVDSPSLVPDGYASSSRGAVFLDLNTNRISPTGQTTGIQLEKDASINLGVKTSPRRCELLSVSTPFLDIPDTELNELVSARTLENGLDEADLEFIGTSVSSASGSLESSRSSVKRIMNGMTDLVIHTEKPLESLNILGSSKDLISSIQESVIDLDLPCEQPNYDVQDLCGIEDDAEVQTSTRIFSIALAAIANDGDPGSEFVIKNTNTALSKISGKSIKFVTSMKSTTVGKKTIARSAENPISASSQNSIKKFSVKSPTTGLGRTLVKSSTSNNERYEIPVTAVADRWDDLDEVIKYSEKVVNSFKNYDNFDLARQGKPVKSALSVSASALGSLSSAGISNSASGISKSSSVSASAASTAASIASKAAVSGKSGRSATRSSTVGIAKQSSAKADSKTTSAAKGVNVSSIKSSKSSNRSRSIKSSKLTSATSGSTEKSSSRSSLIISRLCGAIANVLRREMMLTRATNAGLTASGKNDKVTAFVRSLMSAKSSISSLSLLNIGSSCTGKIVTTHVDNKKSIILLEPRTFSNQKKTYTGAYENIILPAVKFPGNNAPITTYVDNLKSNVVNPIDQLLNIMLVDVANIMTPTTVLRTAFAEMSPALSSLDEIITQNGGGVANEQIIELICMNLYASPNFKRRSKQVIYEKFLAPDKQFSFDGSSGSVSSTISNPDSKTAIKMKTTADGKTTETSSQIETKDQTGEDEESTSSPGDFAEDISSIRKVLQGSNYSGYNEDAASARAGTQTFQTRTSEMLDAFGKSGDSTTLSQAVTIIVEKLLESCKNAIGASILSDDETELKETGLSISALTFMVFDLVSEICRSQYFVYIFKDTGASNYEGTSKEDPSFTITLKSSSQEKGDYQTPNESFNSGVLDTVAESTGALLGVKEISSGSKVMQAIAKEVQEYENDIRDHYARVFALNEVFDTIYQSFDELRTLLTSGDIGFARQQLSSRRETIKTIEFLGPKILADCRWRFDSRLRSIFDGTATSSQHEIDCIRHFFLTRNSIVSDDVIGSSINSLLCTVGIPFGITSVSRDDSSPSNKLIEVSVSKRDIEFQGLIFEQQKFMFDPLMKVIVRPLSTFDTFQTLIEKRTQYYIFVSGNWQTIRYADAVKRIVSNMNIKENEAIQVIRNHVIDFMAKCFLRYVSMMDYFPETSYRSNKKLSSSAPSQIFAINAKIPIASQGTSISDFIRLSNGGYALKPGPHSIDGANEADARLMYRLMQDPAMSGDFLIEEVFGTIPYEDVYCIVTDPDTFLLKTDGAVPAASYSSIVESLKEVTSIKDPGDSIIVSTKNGKYLRQRDQLRRFSGSEIAATCAVIPPRKIAKKMVSSTSTNKSGKFGFKTPGRRS